MAVQVLLTIWFTGKHLFSISLYSNYLFIVMIRNLLESLLVSKRHLYYSFILSRDKCNFLHCFSAIAIYIPYFCTFCMHLTFILIILSLIFSGRFNVCFTVSFKVSNIPFPNLSILCNLTFYNMLLNNNLGNLCV